MKELEFPQSLVGTWDEVQPRMRELGRLLKRGAALDDLDFGPLIPAEDLPSSYIALNPGEALRYGVHIRPYALLCRIRNVPSRGGIEFDHLAAFEWFLQLPWRYLGLLSDIGGQLGKRAVGARDWHRRFIAAAMAHWNVLEGVGPRYVNRFPPG
jgi:hypothetical protein